MANNIFTWIKNSLGNKLYPYTHADAVYVDDNEESPVNLTETLNDINEKINNYLISEEKLTKTLSDYVKTEDIPDEYDDTALSDRVTANEEAISTLNGTGEGSVSKTVDDALNKFATDISDDGVVNTYKELVDYAASHSSDVAEIVADIADNATAISKLDTKITDLESSVENVYTKDETYSRTEVDDAIANAQLDGGDVDLSIYATTEYVDNAVSNVSVDLTGYATENFVTEKIEEIEIPSLDGYAKTEDIPDVSNFVEKEDGKVLSSNDYTDEEKEKLASIETPPSTYFAKNSTFSSWNIYESSSRIIASDGTVSKLGSSATKTISTYGNLTIPANGSVFLAFGNKNEETTDSSGNTTKTHCLTSVRLPQIDNYFKVSINVVTGGILITNNVSSDVTITLSDMVAYGIMVDYSENPKYISSQYYIY